MLHSCFNGHLGCVNPDHLYLGDALRNAADRASAGRTYITRGEGHAQHKLTDAEVVEIRRLYAGGGVSQRDLAGWFQVSQPLVGKIIRREKWQHIT